MTNEPIDYKIYKDHRSLQYIMRQKDLNSRQQHWIELFADYDLSILYHPGKGNVIVVVLNRKVINMGSLAYFPTLEQPLALEIQSLVNWMVRLYISNSR